METPPLEIAEGGALNSRTHIYVERPSDYLFLDTVSEKASWLNIHGSRTMGKTSMIYKHARALRDRGFTLVVVDAAAGIGLSVPGTRDSVYQWTCRLAESLACRLDIEVTQMIEWMALVNEDMPSGPLLEHLFNGIVKGRTNPILIVIDEYDYIGQLDYCNDLLYGLRYIQSLQASDPESKLNCLSFCFVGWRPISYLGSHAISPFAKTFEITDFTPSQETWRFLRSAFPASRLPPDEVFESVIEWSSGQPLITMQLLSRARQQGCTTAAEVRHIAESVRIPPEDPYCPLSLFHHIDKMIVQAGDEGFAAIKAYELLLAGEDPFSAPGVDLLLLAGLIRRESDGLRIKGGLFRKCFDEDWVARMRRRLASTRTQFRGKLSEGSDRKRVLLINTGGTLGMVERGGKVVAPRDEEEFKEYFQFLESIAEVTYANLFPPRDSINIFPEQWSLLAEYIYDSQVNEYDGLVVAHGTDTMADTASAVAFALGPHLNFPVVFTGAQTTPDVSYGDAHVNLYRACEVAKYPIPEVVICFNNFVYRAVRAQKRDDRRFDGFESPTYPPLAEITGEINIQEKLLWAPGENAEIELRANFAKGIRIIPIFPGLEPQLYEDLLFDEKTTGIILQTSGAGNVPNLEPYSLVEFVNQAYRRGIPVIVTSQYPPDPGSLSRYTPAQAPVDAGAIHAGNMTLAAATTKFRWVLGDVLQRPEWTGMSPSEKRDWVSDLMVRQCFVGEF